MNRLVFKLCGALALLLALSMLCPGASWSQDTDVADDLGTNPLDVALHRNHSDAYVGGEEFTVELSVTGSAEGTYFALGLYETVPAGWTFEGVQVDVGPPPDLLPPQGATGVLEFGWVSPVVPVVMRYFLRIPAQDGGGRVFSGQVEYRLESGPKRFSAPILSDTNGVANEAPVITLRGAAALDWSRDVPFTDPGATARDKEDGDLSNQVQTFGQVDVSAPGPYTITYGVMDSTGLRADPVTRVVTVQAGETPDENSSGGGGQGTPNDSGRPGGSRDPGSGMIAGGTRAAGSSDGNDAPSAPFVVPEIALGGNKPMHQLPAGDDKNSREGNEAERQTSDTPSDGDGKLPFGSASETTGGLAGLNDDTPLSALPGEFTSGGAARTIALIPAILAIGVFFAVTLLLRRFMNTSARQRRVRK